MSEIVLLHPKIIHFPIALLLTGFIMELYSIWKKGDERMKLFSNILFLGGLIGAIFSVISGLLAEYTLGHDSPNHEYVHEHKYIMLSTTGIWLLSSLLVKYKRSWLIFSYFILSILLGFGADKGGNLVYRYGIGVEVIPEKSDQQKKPTEGQMDMEGDHHDHLH